MTITEQKIIPNGWHEFKLGEDFILSQGKYLTKQEMSDTGYPVYGANGVIGHSDNFMYGTPTVLVSCRGANCGFVHITKPKSWVSNNSIAVLPKTNQVDPFFLYYKFYHDGFNGFITGSAQPQIVVNVLARKEIVIPPINEQKKIAEILSLVDEDIQETNKIICQTEKLKKGLMQELFTKGIGHKKFKKTKIGDVPKEWAIKELREITEKIGDGLHGTPNYSDSSGYYFINGNNLFDNKVNFYKETKLVSEKEYELYRKDLRESTIFLSINGTIGNIAFYNDEKVVLGKSIAYINCDKSVIKEFVAYQIQADRIKSYFEKSLTGTTIKNLSLGTIRQTPILLPEKNEQKKITDILLLIDEKISVNKEIKEKLNLLKKGLMQDLLSGKVRVNN